MKRTASSKLKETLDESSARICKSQNILVCLPDLTEHRRNDINKVNQFIVYQPICNLFFRRLKKKWKIWIRNWWDDRVSGELIYIKKSMWKPLLFHYYFKIIPYWFVSKSKTFMNIYRKLIRNKLKAYFPVLLQFSSNLQIKLLFIY